MNDLSLKESASAFALGKAMDYLNKDPEKNIPKLLKWVEKFDTRKLYKGQISFIKNIVQDPENIWYKYIINIFNDIDKDFLKTTFKNFFVNACIFGFRKQDDIRERYNCNVPWAILMDPTSACNLHCTGCWAAEYGNKLNMGYETLDEIIRQGKDMGIYFYIYSGGEPLVRKADIIRLCKAHPDCEFMAFTNGTLIDDKFAEDMLDVKNFIPTISVEGFEEDTDFRRGKGTFKKVERAMKILKAHKLPFGISCCYTSKNVKTIGSEKYFDQMIDWGAKYAWFFTYMPVGNDAVPELMVSAKQREFMYNQIRKFRSTKPIFTMDFWNDGEYVEGCIAGGRRYLHINANGDIEPCAFIHYSDSNIKDKTLIQALQSPLFMEYKKNQPFNNNHLRPCPLLDNQGALAKVVDASKAYSTDLQNPEDVHKLCAKCKTAANNWAIVAGKIWSQTHQEEKKYKVKS